LAEHYPQHLPVYGAFPRGAQKADFLRYLLVHHYGGAYCDLDLFCGSSLSGILGDAQAVFVTEKMLSEEAARERGKRHPIRRGEAEQQQRIANYFFAARPGHDIFEGLIELIVQRAQEVPREDYDVIYITGPDAMTEAVLSFRDTGTRILSLAEGSRLASHLCRGSWRAGKDAEIGKAELA
ncbi:MAG: hypothetical protein KC800_23770, partial [Candidatus Eremiobacteraeota bacterium]|nr:hypothetical protein [Candidatus Eremiobacteraeota bacterium]